MFFVGLEICCCCCCWDEGVKWIVGESDETNGCDWASSKTGGGVPLGVIARLAFGVTGVVGDDGIRIASSYVGGYFANSGTTNIGRCVRTCGLKDDGGFKLCGRFGDRGEDTCRDEDD